MRTQPLPDVSFYLDPATRPVFTRVHADAVARIAEAHADAFAALVDASRDGSCHATVAVDDPDLARAFAAAAGWPDANDVRINIASELVAFQSAVDAVAAPEATRWVVDAPLVAIATASSDDALRKAPRREWEVRPGVVAMADLDYDDLDYDDGGSVTASVVGIGTATVWARDEDEAGLLGLCVIGVIGGDYAIDDDVSVMFDADVKSDEVSVSPYEDEATGAVDVAVPSEARGTAVDAVKRAFGLSKARAATVVDERRYDLVADRYEHAPAHAAELVAACASGHLTALAVGLLVEAGSGGNLTYSVAAGGSLLVADSAGQGLLLADPDDWSQATLLLAPGGTVETGRPVHGLDPWRTARALARIVGE